MYTHSHPSPELYQGRMVNAGASQRRRALTLPLPDPPPTTLLDAVWATITWTHLPKPTCHQHQSLFLSALPKEVRLLIYEEVIGRNQVLICGEHTDGATLCCHTRFSTDRFRYKPEEKNSIKTRSAPVHMLRLLQTCRLIYSEAVNFLYSTPVFMTRELRTTLTFLSITAPSRLQHIRTFNLSSRLQPHGHSRHPSKDRLYHRDAWTKSWDVFGASLPNLRTLHVKLMKDGNWLHEEMEDVLTLIGQGVKGVDIHGSLQYPWRQSTSEETLEDSFWSLTEQDWKAARWEISARTGWALEWVDKDMDECVPEFDYLAF